MKNTKHDSRLGLVIAGARSAEPVVEIKSYALAGDGMARLVVEVTHTAGSRKDPAVVANTLNRKLLGKMSAVAGSFHSLEKSAFTERLTGIVSVVRQAISADNGTQGFRAVASNMFMDDEKDMWVLRKTEAGQILVKTTGIDDDITLVNMLDSVSCSSAARSNSEFSRMTAQASSVSNNVSGGDFVSYVTQDNLMAMGYVVASVYDTQDLVVLAHGDDGEGETIKRVAVTEIHDQAEFPVVEESKEEAVETVVAAAKGSIDIGYLLAYYKKVYARSPQFYAAFAERLNSHVFC